MQTVDENSSVGINNFLLKKRSKVVFKSFFSKYRSVLPVFFAMSFLCVANANAEGVLKVYNWAEYIGEETISNF